MTFIVTQESRVSKIELLLTIKYLRRSLFNSKVGDHLRPAILLKKRLRHRSLPVDLTKFFKNVFFTEHLRWRLLIICCRILENVCS